jgi:aryl-alcohol dehydrogenase-like predicted oxidoreductase
MERRLLGKTGIEVSRLCYGTLTMSRSQADLSAQEGGELIVHAAESGVDFIDTAELYGTYAHVRYALRHTSIPLVISTKSYAFDRQSARDSVEKARRELDADVIDLFMLHEQETVMTLLGHQEALDFYLSMKEKGMIRAVGISTHAIEPVRAIAQAKRMGQADGPSPCPAPSCGSCWTEFDPGRYREIDVIHPILNRSGIGLLDGTASQMRTAVEEAHQAGVGIFGMKMLGGGNLFNEFDEAVAYALSLEAADAFAVGMQSRDEIDMNIALFEHREVPAAQLEKTRSRKRTLQIEDWCTGCGSCVKECKAGALRVADGKAKTDPDRCVLCSYCARACRDFAIKVI